MSTIRLTEPTCELTLTNDQEEETTVALDFENIDPDAMEFGGAEVTRVDSSPNTLTVEVELPPGETHLTVAPWYSVGDEFTFIALSDSQARGTVETNPIFEDMLNQISAINPVFFINAGDLVQGDETSLTLAEMFTALQETLAETSVPMYPVPGNHDYDNNLSTYTLFFGEPNIRFDVGPLRLIGLSTAGEESRGTVSAGQLTWLETELETYMPLRLTYFHHPLSVPSWGKSTCCFEDTAERDALAELLDRTGVDLVLTGHSQGYDFRHLASNDVSTILYGLYQLITGGAGGNIAQPDGDYHFTLVRVTSSGIEHHVITEDDFGFSVDYDNNRGQSLKARATVENASAIDLPYIRLKFRLNTAANSFLIHDEEGQYYYDYQAHRVGDYTVLYLETTIPARSIKTFIAEPATAIHSGITQTIDTDGIVTYETLPTSTETEIPLTVKPTDAEVTIRDVSSTQNEIQWAEVPSKPSAPTTYTISNLAPNRFMNVTVNGELIERLLVSSGGRVTFTVEQTAEERKILVYFLPEPPQTIITVPADTGTTHVRIFSDSGKVLSQWFANEGTTNTSRLLRRGDLSGDGTDEIMISYPTESGYTNHIYSQDGENTVSFSGGVMPFVGDVTGDEKAEIITLSRARILRWYTYDADTGTLSSSKQTLQKSMISNNSEIVTIADVTSDHSDDILIFDARKKRLVVLTLNEKRFLIESTSRFPYRGTLQAIATGYFQWQDRVSIVLFYKRTSGKQSLVHLVRDGEKNWQRQSIKNFSGETIQTILGASLQAENPDRIVVLFNDGTLTLYTLDSTGFARGDTTTIAENGTTAWQVGVINGGRDVPERLVVSELSAPGRIMVWQYDGTEQKLKQRSVWYGYGDAFTGGTLFADNAYAP